MSIISNISIKREYKYEGAPPCGLYLSTPAVIELNQFFLVLRRVFAIINGSNYEKNSHILEFDPNMGSDTMEFGQALQAICRHNGIVMIVKNDLDLVLNLGADGIVLDKSEQISVARNALGDDAIIGVLSQSYQQAEHAEKLGADFILWQGSHINQLENIKRWSTYSLVPAVGKASTGDCRRLIEAGASFVELNKDLWQNSELLLNVITEFQLLIEQIFVNKSIH